MLSLQAHTYLVESLTLYCKISIKQYSSYSQWLKIIQQKYLKLIAQQLNRGNIHQVCKSTLKVVVWRAFLIVVSIIPWWLIDSSICWECLVC